MLLAAGSVSSFLKVIQIVSWIVLPVLAVVTALTIYLHYRKRKKNRAAALMVEDILPVPASLAQLEKHADYILVDHSDLFRQYHEKLCHSQARYVALQHEFAELKTKCAALSVFAASQAQLSHEIIQYPRIKREIDQFVKKYNTERREWENANEQLSHACVELQKENQRLRERLLASGVAQPAAEKVVTA